MKTQMRCTFVALFLFLFHQAAAQSTAFTYQGRLNDNGVPANGVFDLQFNLYDAPGGGGNLGTNFVDDLSITNGVFTVPLDFGPSVFNGAKRFLEIGVRPGASAGAYINLLPRQMITSVPYAFTASNVSGTVSAAQLSGPISSANVSGTYGNAVTFNNAGNSFSGSGAGLTGLNASELASGLVPDARLADNIARTNRVWLLGGNSGTTPATHFLGTTDPQPLELRVNGAPALRLQPTTNSSMVNVVGGSSGNYVDPGVVGATIAGGGTLNYLGTRDTNRVAANFGAIGGGGDNVIASGADYSAIGGGNHNGIRGDAYGSIVAGGVYNTIETNAAGGIIGGGSANTIQANAGYSTIAGGAGNFIQTGAVHAAIGGGFNNTNGGPQAFIGSGRQNFISGYRAVIGGGYQNVATNFETTIGGGVNNFAGGWNATIGGGALNTASGDYSVVGAGFQNQATTNYATVPGGYGNRANGEYSLAAGRFGRADHNGAFVWADSLIGNFASTTSNQFSVRANGGVRLVTGGAGMTLDGQPVLSGTITSNQLADSAIGTTQIADGAVTTAKVADGSIRSGDLNLLSFATTFWKADGNSGTTAGANFIGTTDSQPLEFKVNSQRALRLEPNTNGAPNVIGGSSNNFVGRGVVGATIAGGELNNIGTNSSLTVIGGGGENSIGAYSSYSTIAGGRINSIGRLSGPSAIGGGIQNNIGGDNAYATIAGGGNNDIGSNGVSSAIGGGFDNNIGAYVANATIAGGYLNSIGTNADSSAIGGGYSNNIAANASYAAIGGGFQNIASGLCATVPGGQQNTAAAFGSFAAGFRAKANHLGSFVWADDHAFDFASTAANKVRFRCTSGFDIITAIDGSGNQTAGVFLSPGDTSWNVISDRNAKKNLQPVDAVAVLDKLAAIPITQWNYKWESETNTPHLGPMAQDFKAAFFPGRDDKSISTLEFDGVELAAIQGLNERMKEKDARILALEKSVTELKELVTKLADKH